MFKLNKMVVVLLAFSLFLLNSCTQNPVSTSDELSTDASSMGKLTYSSVEEFDEVADIFNSSNSPDILSNKFPSELFSTVSLKKGTIEAQDWNSVLIGDRLVLTRTSQSAVVITYDTVVVKNDPGIILGQVIFVEVRTKSVFQNRTEHLVIEDNDGDGILKGTSQHNGSLKFTLTTIFTKNTLIQRSGDEEVLKLIVSAGESRNFDNLSDNAITGADWHRYRSGQVIAYVIYTDADGDGIIWSENIEQSAMDLKLFNSSIPGRPLVKSSKLNLRIQRTIEGIEKLIRFSGEEELSTGCTRTVYVVNQDGDSTVNPKDMAYIHISSIAISPSERELNAEYRFVVNVGENLGDVTDNHLHRITVSKEKRFGIVKKYQYDFNADPAVSYGHKATGGTFSLNAETFDGKTASLTGSFSPDHLNATHISVEGTVTTVTVDRDGNVATL